MWEANYSKALENARKRWERRDGNIPVVEGTQYERLEACVEEGDEGVEGADHV